MRLPAMEEMLARGRVPAPPILSLLEDHVEHSPPNELLYICERQELNFETVARVLSRYIADDPRDQIRSLDFDTADKLLCGMHRIDLWRSELSDIYYAVDLAWVKCECPGCEEMIHRLDQPVVCKSCGTSDKPIVARGLCAACTMYHKYHGSLEQFPKLGRGGGAQSAYCSKACREAHGRMKRGESQSGKRLKVRSTHCRKGHRRTKENTKIRANGKIECRICHREGARASYYRRQAAKRARAAA